MWIRIVHALFSLVLYIVKRRSEAEQREIGRNEVIQRQLVEIALRTRIAREINEDSTGYNRDDIDRIMHKYYRADDDSA